MNRRDFFRLTGAGLLVPDLATPPTCPPLAAADGYTNLAFTDDFTSPPDIGYGTEGHKWNAGLWWEPVPDPSCFVQSGSKLTITVPPTGLDHVDLCTQWHDFQGGTQFQGGYFEARMCCFDWSAFWLFCWDRPTVYGSKVLADNPMTWTNEIDICEFDGGYPYSVWCTLHSNSSSDTVPDQINSNNRHDTNAAIVGNWHNYGLLWTPSQLTWFVDEIPIMSLPPYASTNQPTQLILTAGAGGVNGSPSKTTPPQLKVDWVNVWTA